MAILDPDCHFVQMTIAPHVGSPVNRSVWPHCSLRPRTLPHAPSVMSGARTRRSARLAAGCCSSCSLCMHVTDANRHRSSNPSHRPASRSMRCLAVVTTRGSVTTGTITSLIGVVSARFTTISSESAFGLCRGVLQRPATFDQGVDPFLQMERDLVVDFSSDEVRPSQRQAECCADLWRQHARRSLERRGLR
jgi:hypothetical protein